MRLSVYATRYVDNGRFAVQTLLDTTEGFEPYANLTVNLVDETIPFDTEEVAYGFVDTNNWPKAEGFIKRADIGEKTEFIGHSGYCSYPLYRFDRKKIEKLSKCQRVIQFNEEEE